MAGSASTPGAAPARRGCLFSGTDLSGVTETPLGKLLRLAGTARQTVPVRMYQRVERGRPQVVRQHVQGHVAGGSGLMPASSLKPGNVIQVGRTAYTVTAIKPYKPTSAAAKPNTAGTKTAGAGVNTAGPKSTASAGAGVNTSSTAKSTASAGAGVSAAADPQVILNAAAKAQKIANNAPELDLTLQQPGAKSTTGVLVATTLKIQVLR
jgi:hypothetical protein